MYACMYVCSHVCARTYVYMSVDIRVYIYIYIYTYVCIMRTYTRVFCVYTIQLIEPPVTRLLQANLVWHISGQQLRRANEYV